MLDDFGYSITSMVCYLVLQVDTQNEWDDVHVELF